MISSIAIDLRSIICAGAVRNGMRSTIISAGHRDAARSVATEKEVRVARGYWVAFAGLLAGQALPDTDDGKARAVRMAVELYVVIRETLSDIQPPADNRLTNDTSPPTRPRRCSGVVVPWRGPVSQNPVAQ